MPQEQNLPYLIFIYTTVSIVCQAVTRAGRRTTGLPWKQPLYLFPPACGIFVGVRFRSPGWPGRSLPRPADNPMLPDRGGGPPAAHRFRSISNLAGSEVEAQSPVGFLHPSTQREHHVRRSFQQAIHSVRKAFHALRTFCKTCRTGCRSGGTAPWSSG